MADGADRSAGSRIPKPTRSTIIASVLAGLAAVAYSAMLGFGVQETCDTLASSGSECNRLSWMALCHAGTQMLLVLVAGLVGVSVWRATSGWKRRVLVCAIVLVCACLVAAAAVVYTDAAWDWANSRS